MGNHQYPIGRFNPIGTVSAEQRELWIKEDRRGSTERLRVAVEGLSDNQLDTPYRTEGWTIRQECDRMNWQ